MTVKVQLKLDVLGHFVEKGGQAIFCFSHLLTDLTNEGPSDGCLVTTLSTKGLTLTNDQAEEESRFFVPVSDISVKLLWQRLEKVLAVLEMHALLINL